MTARSSDQHQRNGTAGQTSLESLSFDELLEALEKVVQQLESDQLSLDASIDTFERGVRFAARCQQLLRDAELRISRITEEIGETEPYASPVEDMDDIEDEELD